MGFNHHLLGFNQDLTIIWWDLMGIHGIVIFIWDNKHHEQIKTGDPFQKATGV